MITSKTNKVARKISWYNGRRRGGKPYDNYRKVPRRLATKSQFLTIKKQV